LAGNRERRTWFTSVPGWVSHRLAEPPLALAELVYSNGFSAVCVSSPFNFEFMENASTAAMPAYLPVDGHDLHVALTELINTCIAVSEPVGQSGADGLLHGRIPILCSSAATGPHESSILFRNGGVSSAFSARETGRERSEIDPVTNQWR